MEGPRTPVRVAQRTWRLLISAYFLMLVAVAAAVIPVLVSTNLRLDREQATYDPATSASYMLLIGALNQETGVRGYSLTGDASYLQPYMLGSAQYSSAIKQLAGIDLGSVYSADLSATEAAFKAWQSVAQHIIAKARSGAGVRQAAFLEQAAGKQHFDSFRSKQSALAVQVESATNASRRSLHSRVTASIVLSITALLFGAVLGLLIFAWWRRYGRNADLAQQQLLEQTRLAQAAIDVTSDSVFVKDTQGRHILANMARVISLSGGNADADVIGHSVDDFVSPEAAQAVRENEADVLRTGRSRQFEEVLTVNGEPRHYAVTKSPLTDEQGHVVGVVGVARDVTEELARLAEMERLHGIERDIGQRLQNSMLGSTDVNDSRIEVSAYYQPATAETFIGGDWYDVLSLGRDAVALVIGDVVGHGLDAIAAMGQLRSAMSALAYLNEAPDRTIENLESFARSVANASFATCLFGRLDLQSRTLEYSSAGHMPAVLLDPGGEARLLDSTQDPPLGARTAGRRHSISQPLQSGSILLLFTDGLVERRGEMIQQGLDRLTASLQLHSHLPIDEICDKLVSDLVPSGSQDDDIAIVAAKIA